MDDVGYTSAAMTPDGYLSNYTPGQWSGDDTQPTCGESPAPCSANTHYFECKHEAHCACGKTGRVDVEPGL